MKASKIVIPIILLIGLCLAWFSFATGVLSDYASYRACMGDAERSIEEGLYEQAVEYYKDSLEYENSESIYIKIKEVYDLLYAEEHTPFIRNLYIDDMAVAAEAFPKNAEFWTVQVRLHIEAQNYTKAYSTVNRARNYGAKSTELDELYTTLLYMVKPDYKLFKEFKTALNGYITVCDGTNWYVIDEHGDQITSNYGFVGLVNDEGKGLYTNSVDTRLLDISEVPRARFSVTVEDAGYYNDASNLLPVKTDGIWRYLNSDGEMLPGEYKIAGSFYNHQAVAYTGTQWVTIDDQGNETILAGFEDVKLDLYGCHIQNGIVLAKSGEKYRIYDTSFNEVANFEADDVDLCIDSERIAFQKDGKWGFVDSKGNVVVEPMFAGARSFANGYAAVCNEEGFWGFINEKYELVIDYAYLDAFYFTKAATCMVSTVRGTVQMLHFIFE